MSTKPSNAASIIVVAKVMSGSITIYHLTHTKKKSLYYRFKDPISGRYVRRSTGTTDLAIASSKAIDAWNEAQAKKHLGIQKAKTTIRDLFDAFDSELSPSTQNKRALLMRNYLIPFFGNDDLASITESDVISWVKWRANPSNWTSKARETTEGALKIATIKTEMNYLGRYLARGFERRMILHKVRMPTPSRVKRILGIGERQANRRRGRLSEGQSNALSKWQTHYRRAFVSGSGKYFDAFVNVRKESRFAFARFYAIVVLMKSTGVRPVECFKLSWGDVSLWRAPEGLDYTVINVSREASKVNKQRDCISKDFDRLHKVLMGFYRSEYVRMFGEAPDDDDVLFPSTVDRNGPATNRSKAFRIALTAISDFVGVDLTVSDDGASISAYSLRSLYATEMLRETSIDVHTLARQMGNSPAEIIRTYDVNLNINFRDALTEHYRKYATKDSE